MVDIPLALIQRSLLVPRKNGGRNNYRVLLINQRSVGLEKVKAGIQTACNTLNLAMKTRASLGQVRNFDIVLAHNDTLAYTLNRQDAPVKELKNSSCQVLAIFFWSSAGLNFPMQCKLFKGRIVYVGAVVKRATQMTTVMWQTLIGYGQNLVKARPNIQSAIENIPPSLKGILQPNQQSERLPSVHENILKPIYSWTINNHILPSPSVVKKTLEATKKILNAAKDQKAKRGLQELLNTLIKLSQEVIKADKILGSLFKQTPKNFKWYRDVKAELWDKPDLPSVYPTDQFPERRALPSPHLTIVLLEKLKENNDLKVQQLLFLKSLTEALKYLTEASRYREQIDTACNSSSLENL